MTDMNHRRAEIGFAGVTNGAYLIAVGRSQGQQLDTYEVFENLDGADIFTGAWN